MLCAGCRREKIAVYDIPKDSDSATAMAPADASQLPIKFQAPADWQVEPAGEMSVATFSMAGRKAEVSVMSFPGDASKLSLINIVRQSSGFAPLSDDELAKLQETVAVGDEKGSLIDLSGGADSSTNASARRTLVAVLAHNGVTWFFKMAGAPDVVAAQKPELLAFLKSVSFVEGGGAASMAANPHGGNILSANTGAETSSMGTLPAADGPTETKPSWNVPTNWNESPPTQMLLAKFVVRSGSGEADVTVSEFPGEVGGLLANVNRWRASVGLAAVGEADLEKSYTSLDVPDGKAMLVDVNGQSKKNGKDTRLIGVIWPRNGETWFYKLMGDSAAAGPEKDAFLKFIQSVHYPNG